MAVYDVLVVDAQNDFCHPAGALFVPGAQEDTARLCALLDRLESTGNIGNYHVTMDTHFVLDISHPGFWRDEKGNMPDPFTRILPENLISGRWLPKDPSARGRALQYLEKLKETGRYDHTIWPEHCLLGSWGHCLVEDIFKRVTGFERREGRRVNYVVKGMNMWTEHYSVLKAEVEDPEDPGTCLNRKLLEALSSAGPVLITGQALSHCVANTVTDLIGNLEAEALERMVILRDTTSCVPGFEELGEAVLEKASKAGMKVCSTGEIPC